MVSTPSRRRAGYSLSASSPGSGSTWPRSQYNQILKEATAFKLLARPEHERRCIDLFWEAYFPSGQPLPTEVSRSYTCGWTETAQKFYREDDSLRFSLLANCLFLTGRRHGVVWMLRDGLQMYGKALVSLRGSIGTPNRARRDSIIATVKLLTMFEVSTPG